MIHRIRYALVLWLTLGSSLSAQHSLHYWFNDPEATQHALSPTQSSGDEISYDIPTEQLPVGLHTLYVQQHGANQQLSPVRSALFLKVKPTSEKQSRLRYWFDNIHETSHKMITFSDKNDVIDLAISTEDLSPGLHTLYTQYEGESGERSAVHSVFFVKHTPHGKDGKRRLLYWFNHINVSPRFIEIPGTGASSHDLLIPTKGLPEGLHTLYTQYEGADGTPSPMRSVLFLKTPTSADKGSKIKALRYWFDNDRTKSRIHNFEHLLDAGSELTIEVDGSGLLRGKHTLYAETINAKGVSGKTQTLPFVVANGIPNEVCLRRLSPDPNELAPKKIMTGSHAYVHYQITDTAGIGVEGVQLKYDVLLNGKTLTRETESSDAHGVVELPLSTGLSPVREGDLISYAFKGAKVGQSQKELAFHTVDITPIEFRIIPLRSKEMEIGLGAKVKAKGGVKINKAASIGAAASAGGKVTLKIERDLEENITDVAYGGKLSVKGELEGKLESGKHEASLGVGGAIEAGAEISGEPGKELYFTTVSALALAQLKTNPFMSGAALIGVNALREHLEKRDNWDFDKISITPTLKAQLEGKIDYQYDNGKKKNLYKEYNLHGLSGKFIASWSKSNLLTLAGSDLGEKHGRKLGFEISGNHSYEFKKRRSNSWKTLQAKLGLPNSIETPEKSGSAEFCIGQSSTIEKLNSTGTMTQYKNLEMNKSFSYEVEQKGIKEIEKFLKEYVDLEDFGFSFGQTYSDSWKASGYFANHLRQNSSKLSTVFPQLSDNSLDILNQVSMFWNDKSRYQELASASEEVDEKYSVLSKDLKRTKEFTQEMNASISIPIYKSPPKSLVKWSLSVGGELDFELTYPAAEYYWSTKYQRMFPTYVSEFFYLPLPVKEMGTQLMGWLGTFIKNAQRAFEPEIPKLEQTSQKMCKLFRSEVKGPMEFRTVPRFYAAGLSRIKTLRKTKQKSISQIKFNLPSGSLPLGAQTTFYQFYPGGDLMGHVQDSQEEIVILSDFCVLRAEQNGAAITETSQPFKVQASIGADDLKLLNFAPNTNVHLFYSSRDDSKWVDLGSINNPIETRGLGTYALAAKMEADSIAPELSLRLDTVNRLLMVDVQENVAIRPKSVQAQVNGTSMSVQQVDKETYTITLSEEQMKSDTLQVFISMSDFAGNKGQLDREFILRSPTAISPVVSEYVKVSPTMAHAQLNIECSSGMTGRSVCIYDMLGVKRLETVLQNTHTVLNISELTPGSYLLCVGNETHRFVKL